METTLTLHDIAPFLPFQLTGKAWIYYLKETAQWVDCTVVGATPKDLLLQCYDHGGNKWPGAIQLDYKYFKPNLRPIGDLIRIISIGGNAFKPLYELNRMRGVTMPIHQYDLFEDDGNCLICKWAGVYSFYFERQTKSFYDNSVTGISPQLEMFQKLFEWKFDVNNLLGRNLATPIQHFD